jgi:2-hydroxycyclohexanecarboxyl-CoA dehydrogenase
MLLEAIERVPRARTEQLERTFSPRLGQPDDMAAACAYLLSDDAGYLNGANLCIYGGRTVAI